MAASLAPPQNGRLPLRLHSSFSSIGVLESVCIVRQTNMQDFVQDQMYIFSAPLCAQLAQHAS